MAADINAPVKPRIPDAERDFGTDAAGKTDKCCEGKKSDGNGKKQRTVLLQHDESPFFPFGIGAFSVHCVPSVAARLATVFIQSTTFKQRGISVSGRRGKGKRLCHANSTWDVRRMYIAYGMEKYKMYEMAVLEAGKPYWMRGERLAM
jgi:hypothetical protein